MSLRAIMSKQLPDQLPSELSIALLIRMKHAMIIGNRENA